jgi:hypothetical protein
MVFGMELRLPCDLSFGAPPDKGHSTTNYVTEIVDLMHAIHQYICRYSKVFNEKMEARYDRLANFAGFYEGVQVWLYPATRTRGKSPKLQPSWEGPCKVITQINDVVTGSSDILGRR